MTAAAHSGAVEAAAADRPHRAVDLLIASTGILTGIAMTGLAPVLPMIAAALGNGAAGGYLVKLVIAVVGLAVMIAAPLSGRIARRYRCGDVVALCFATYAGAALASALAPSLGWLVAARFVQGVAVAIGVTMLLALAGTIYEPRMRDRLLGLHMGLSAIILLAVLPLAGALGDLSWRLAPLIGLVSLGHLALALKARHALGFRLAAPSAADARAGLDRAERIQAITVAALAFLIGVALYSGPAFLPFKLVAIGVTSGKAIGLVSTVATACSALGSLAYAQVTARFAPRTVYAVALTACAAGALLLAAAGSAVAVIVAQIISGAGGGVLLAHIYGDCAHRFAAGRRAFGTGLVKASSFAGLFVGPLVLQAVVARYRIDAAFLATALVLGAALAIAMLARSGLPRPELAR